MYVCAGMTEEKIDMDGVWLFLYGWGEEKQNR